MCNKCECLMVVSSVWLVLIDDVPITHNDWCSGCKFMIYGECEWLIFSHFLIHTHTIILLIGDIQIIRHDCLLQNVACKLIVCECECECECLTMTSHLILISWFIFKSFTMIGCPKLQCVSWSFVMSVNVNVWRWLHAFNSHFLIHIQMVAPKFRL